MIRTGRKRESGYSLLSKLPDDDELYGVKYRVSFYVEIDIYIYIYIYIRSYLLYLQGY